MTLTSIKFPAKTTIRADAEGYPAEEDIEWSEEYPAKVKDTTRTEAVKAHQTGYDIDKVFVVGCYGGQTVLKDMSDGAIYDIERTYRAENSFDLQLDCKRRKPGAGYEVKRV